MPLPERMRAVQIREPGGPEVLEITEIDLPRPAAGEVLVRVAAAGVNGPDLLQRMGRYPLPEGANPLPGLEIAGTVVAAGANVTRWREGAAVMALTAGGGYAEFCAVQAAHCLPVPESLSLREAAAVPETFFTVEFNLFTRAALAAGETLLVHGGAGGIGSTTIQLAKARGALVATTAGSQEKCEFCRNLGADLAVNYRDDDWPAAVDAWIRRLDREGVDVVLDMIAGHYFPRHLQLLARDGRYSLIAFKAGREATFDAASVLLKRLTITGSTLRPLGNEQKASIARDVEERALPLLASGQVKPVISARFPLAEARHAHALMESGGHRGKIVLDVGAERLS